MLRSLYPLYPVDGLGGPQDRPGHSGGKQKYPCPCGELNPCSPWLQVSVLEVKSLKTSDDGGVGTFRLKSKKA